MPYQFSGYYISFLRLLTSTYPPARTDAAARANIVPIGDSSPVDTADLDVPFVPLAYVVGVTSVVPLLIDTRKAVADVAYKTTRAINGIAE